MTTEKSIKLKSGEVLQKGLTVTFQKESPSVCLVHSPSRPEPFKVRVSSAFHQPDMSEIEDAVCDSVCPSIGGEDVEPDGWDSQGSPSWLLALGMI